MPPALRNRRKSSFAARGRRGFVFATTAWFAIVTTGVPLPAGAAIDLAGGPFPCQGHACGCRSAAACWADCCCYSHEQKQAWAKANGVTPPAGAPVYDPKRLKSKASASVASKSRACCAKGDDCATGKSESRACCAAKVERATCCESESSSDDSPASRSIVVLDAMKCRGVATTWIGTGQPFVAPAAIEWRPEIVSSIHSPATRSLVACCRPGYVGPPG